MMQELLDRINETFNKSIANSNEEVQLQVKILKNNINALFAEYAEKENSPATPASATPVVEAKPAIEVAPVTEAASNPEQVVDAQPVAPTTTVSTPEIEQVETLEEPANDEPDVLDQEDMKSILIVDDSSMIRNYLERIFINEYNISMAVDGNDAIDKININKDKLNIILLDLVMPKADGFFVLEHIQKNAIDVPVIVISGDTSKESINKAFEYGVVDLIKKPFDSDLIKEKIMRYSK